MRKKISTNTTITIELEIFLLGFGHFAYPRLVLFSHLTFTQWIQKFNNFLLKLVEIFRFKAYPVSLLRGSIKGGFGKPLVSQDSRAKLLDTPPIWSEAE